MSESFQEIILKDILSELGEDTTRGILSQFSCPLNNDVEDFLVNKSIDFTNQGIAATTLVYCVTENKKVLVGYYTLTNKALGIDDSANISGVLKKRISKFKSPGAEQFIIPAILLAQFSKNFTDGANNLISGDELMELALNKINEIHKNLGGKVSYLECEEKEKLISFYESHGFISFSRRAVDGDNFLVQMLKYG